MDIRDRNGLKKAARASIAAASGSPRKLILVYTGVQIAFKGRRKAFYQTTDVKFYPLTKEELDRYIESGEWFGKAGAYGIQGPAALFVESIRGDYNNIFGLPAAQLMREIRQLTAE
jgi:septum formation protein